MDDTPWFGLVLGFPALLGWLAYGICWLLDGRLGGGTDALFWAGSAVAIYYALMISLVIGSNILD